MLKNLFSFLKPANFLEPSENETAGERDKRYKRLRFSVFLAGMIGYGLYYVCRLSLNVIKKPLVDNNILSERELGIVGSALFFAYAAGKFTNGFLADRSHIKRFMSIGLLVSALVNLSLGFTNSFILFAVLWGVNGWFQSIGSPSAVVGLSRWYPSNIRGTYYGFFSASHNIGEAITFIAIATLATALGWRYGFIGAGVIGLMGVVLIYFLMHDSPQSKRLENPNPETDETKNELSKAELNKAQASVLKMPAIWLLALSSAFMYVSRYAVNSWGVFYLEAQKGYTTLDASYIISISSICGIVGTVFSGLISDKLFGGRRNIPALVFGLMVVVSLCMFLLVDDHSFWLDAAAMVLFGLGIGVLICFLGGLMAIDIVPKNAAGAALGVVGIASYIGAGIQDIMSGILIEGNKTMVAGKAVYDFTYINYFWIGASVLSVLFALTVWNAKAKQ